MVELWRRICSLLRRSVFAIRAFIVEFSTDATHLFAAIKAAATRPVFDLPRLRKACAVLLLFLVPIFIGIGFGVQAVDVVGGSTTAILWFGASAILAAILVLIWEEIIAIQGWKSRVILTILLEAFTVNLFNQGAGWVARKAVEESDARIRDVGERSQEAGLYRKWLSSQEHPQRVSNDSQPVKPARVPKPMVEIKPDIAVALLYPEEFAVVIINRSSTLLNKPKWGFAIWDLDKLDSSGRPTVLPIPTVEGDWIRGHEALGPETAISQVETLLKPGDRLFGYITVLCPDCLRDRSYWVYATFKQGGWFSEVKNGFPDLSLLAKNIVAIQKDPEAFFGGIPQSDRIPIYSSMRDIPNP